jgi:hypothetical protein
MRYEQDAGLFDGKKDLGFDKTEDFRPGDRLGASRGQESGVMFGTE